MLNQSCYHFYILEKVDAPLVSDNKCTERECVISVIKQMCLCKQSVYKEATVHVIKF